MTAAEPFSGLTLGHTLRHRHHHPQQPLGVPPQSGEGFSPAVCSPSLGERAGLVPQDMVVMRISRLKSFRECSNSEEDTDRWAELRTSYLRPRDSESQRAAKP